MNPFRPSLLVPFVIASAGAVAFGSGRQVQVMNRYNSPWKLSDLYLYGANGEENAYRLSHVEFDDEEIPGMGTRIYPTVPTSFPITSYVISSSSGSGATYVEWETWAFNVTKVVPRKLSYFSENGTNRPLVASVDSGIASNDALTNGTQYAFVNGASASLPGWGMYNDFNFTTGQPLDPFTGTAYVYDTPFEAMVVPEPAMRCSVGSALVLLGLLTRARK